MTRSSNDKRANPPGEAELLQRIGDVVLDRVDADAEAARDPGIAQAVANRLGHAPFRRCQQIVVTRAATGSRHHATLARPHPNFPTRRCALACGRAPTALCRAATTCPRTV